MNYSNSGYSQPACLVAFSGEAISDLMSGEPAQGGPRSSDSTMKQDRVGELAATNKNSSHYDGDSS